MIQFSLSELEQPLKAQRWGEAYFQSISIDSRRLRPGDCFIALQGQNFDGHDFIDQAIAAGASAIIAQKPLSFDHPHLLVSNSLQALQQLAMLWRQKSSAQRIAITGSNGKTTVKQMVAAILQQVAPTLATEGNLNNHIGLPLTLCRLQNESFAVLEMGANHPGEIDQLSRIAQPQIAVLNNAGAAHLEGFGSIAGVAKAKLEIIHGLEASGTFIYYGEDAFADYWQQQASAYSQIRFGTRDDFEVYSLPASWQFEWQAQSFISCFEVHTPQESFKIALPLAGEHNVLNALAAIAVAHALQIETQAIIAGLQSLPPVPGRLCPLPGYRQSLLIDDSYNANPHSVRQALRLLSSAPGRKIMVLGDLGELGQDSADWHRQIGAWAQAYGIDQLYSLGPLSRLAAQSFGQGQAFDQAVHLITALKQNLQPGDTVLVKGSRAARMETIVQALGQ